MAGLIKKTKLETLYNVSRTKLKAMLLEAGIDLKKRSWYLTPKELDQFYQTHGEIKTQ